MFREILPILAYMSMLSGSYSLHMARDAYIKAPPPPPAAAQLLEELDDVSELLAENSIPAGPPALHSKVHHQGTLLQQQQQQQQQMAPQLHTIGGVAAGGPHGVVINHLTSNELPELSPPPVRHPVGPLIQPRGLQELFGVQTNFDMRNMPQLPPLQQQQQQQQLKSSAADGANSDEDLQQQQPRNPNNKRSSHNNSNGGGTADGTGGGYMDDGPSSSGGGGGGSSSSNSNNNGGMPQIPHGMASQLMLRSARGQRQYDVPQIECPPAMDGMERFACPTPDRQGRYRCIDDHVLCDGFIDCPEGEDEDRQACMFYKTTKAHLDVLADALLRWARGR
ncbi:signal transducer and activator of transcription A [Sabethes cyaneus]|uniref:signal transducer and activator of transcription A n=1 Tax=Sabethes cyaneus TaxID=53552 RepID=UPI00237E247A|nr:signal transducer and activator of transcription A [Sabethes cyaneus]